MKQFGTFLVVGGLNTAMDFGIYFLLTRFFGLYFIYANILSVSISIVFGFFMHKHLTFQNVQKSSRQFFKFVILNLATLIFNTGIVYLVVHYLFIMDMGAKVIATGLVMFWSFFMQKYWIFGSRNAKYLV